MDLVGTTVGNLRIEELLGTGGMGEVYRGFDPRLERHVAVKTIRARHRLDQEMKARFLREARILSRLDHPAICQVYDLIEDEETDFLLFEFVEGVTLRSRIEAGDLDEQRALELAERIALALGVAHRERIVHRDLKPENVMVTPSGEVKILDFGISRALKEPASGGETTAKSGPSDGRPPLPTPSSVQDPDATVQLAATVADPAGKPDPPSSDGPDAEPSTASSLEFGETVVTRPGEADGPGVTSSLGTDITRQGAIVGTLRYMSPEQVVGEDVGPASDMFAFGLLVQELVTGEPAYGDAPISVLMRRVSRSENRPLEHEDADLSRLVEDLKRLAPDRRPSAEEAAERIRWVLDRPQRRRRRRFRLAASVAAFVLLSVVLAVVSVLAIKASREADRANREADRANSEAQRANLEAESARQVSDFLVELFEEANPRRARGREVPVREIVDLGAERIEGRLTVQPLVGARLMDTLGTIYWNLGLYDEADTLLSSALDTRRAAAASDGARAQSLGQLAGLRADQGRLEDAEVLFGDAIELLSEDPELAAQRAEATGDLASLFVRLGRYDEAETLFEETLSVQEATLGSEAEELTGTLNNLAILAWQTGDYPRARELYGRSVRNLEATQGSDHPDLAAMLNNLGILLRGQGEYALAEARHRRALAIAEKALGPRHPDVAAIHFSLGTTFLEQERLDEALVLFQQALELRRDALGESHHEVARTRVSLGDLYRRLGDLERAAPLLEDGVAGLESSLGADHPTTVESLRTLADLERDRRRPDRARELYRRALASAVASLGEDDPEVALLRARLASLSSIPASR
ncbi:MAG: serine/threonine-protein kinase [Acidobacteriota bacterium]